MLLPLIFCQWIAWRRLLLVLLLRLLMLMLLLNVSAIWIEEGVGIWRVK